MNRNQYRVIKGFDEIGKDLTKVEASLLASTLKDGLVKIIFGKKCAYESYQHEAKINAWGIYLKRNVITKIQ